MSKTTTVRLSDDRVEKLDRIGRHLKRSRNWLINQAIEDYLARELSIIASIETGLAQAKAGEFVDDNEMQKAFNRFSEDSN